MKASVSPRTSLLQSLAEASESIRQHRVSPVDVVTTCLDGIERLQPRLNVFISVVADAALQPAKAAEKDIEQGRA